MVGIGRHAPRDGGGERDLRKLCRYEWRIDELHRNTPRCSAPRGSADKAVVRRDACRVYGNSAIKGPEYSGGAVPCCGHRLSLADDWLPRSLRDRRRLIWVLESA